MFIKLTSTALLTSVSIMSLQTSASAKDKTQPKPNIIFYVVDDLGTNDAGCYGNKVIKTPGLDELAKQGVRFTNAFATCATCSASRSVMLSGMYNHATAHYGHAHSYHHFSSFDWVKSLPNLLGENGYRTARIGKYHLAPKEVYEFQEVIGVKHKDSVISWADKCRGLIENQSKDPFFLYFCTHEPHRPFRRDGSAIITPEEVNIPDYLPDTPETREEWAMYHMSAERADSGLKRLIEILKETGKWDNTVILFCSDNGAPFPGAKTNVYEPALRLPFVLRAPGVTTPSTVNNAMLSYVDITPTLLDFAGVKTPYKLHGRSFKNIVNKENPKGWDQIYASHTFHEITMYYPMRVVHGRKHKLIWNIASALPYPHASDLWASKTWQSVLKSGQEKYGQRTVKQMTYRDKFELYDLVNDPGESTNQVNNPKYKQVFEAMKNNLKAFQKRTKDPWHVKWFHE